MSEATNTTLSKLRQPFQASEVKFKPAVVSGNRALALAYVDARVIQDRLDEVLGPENWKDAYRVVDGNGSVICRLSLRLDGKWISKTDVGGASGQPDEGDRMKAGFSDALKRAAVKWGIGRYLYRFPSQWVDWDANKKVFKTPPRIPDSALPGKKTQVAAPKNNAGNGNANLPKTGLELQRRLYDYDSKLAKQGVCYQGDLVKHVVNMGVRAGYDSDISKWTGNAMLLAAQETKAFEAQQRKAAQ